MAKKIEHVFCKKYRILMKKKQKFYVVRKMIK